MSDINSNKAEGYNYESFKPKYYNFFDFKGPKAGEQVIDFEATTLKGEKVKLSDYFGKWIVLESGSFSCPMYVGNILDMNTVAKEFQDVEFLVLYVREAHPGSNVPAQSSLEEKLKHAGRLPGEESENRTILVDSIDGNAHNLYGSFPDFVYIINPQGTVVFRSDWNIPTDVEKILLEGRNEIHMRDHYEPGKPSIPTAIRVLARAGLNSLWDFTIGLPELMQMHKNVDKAYEEHSKK
ncbi:MAG: deiodinase-like protein [Thermodesulfobacteriota bacterium]